MTDPLDELPVKSADTGLGDLPVQTDALVNLSRSTAGIDPTHAAKVMGLANQFQAEPESVASDVKGFESASKSAPDDLLNSLPVTHPRTADYLSDPRNMAVARDNVPSLQAHESTLQDHGLMSNILMSTGSALNATALGASRLPALVGGQVAGLENLVNKTIPYGQQMFGQATVPTSWYHNSLTDFLESNDSWYKNSSMQQNFLDEIGKGNVAHASGALYSQFVAPMIPLVMASLAGQPEAGLGLFGAQVGGEGFVQGKKTGMTDTGASSYGVAKGSVLLAAGKLGESLADIYGAVAAKYGPALGRQAVGRLAVKSSQAMLGSGSTMATMTAADKLVDYATGVDSHAMEGFTKDVVTSFAGGALVPAAGIPFGVMRARLEERQAETDRTTYSDLASQAADDKLRARSTEDYSQAVNTLAEGRNIYIPASKFTEYFQSQNIDPKEIASELGVTDSLHEAQQTGGSVEIPLGEWMKAVGTEHEAGLRDHVKFDPEGMTVAEVADSARSAEAQAKKDIDALEKQQAAYHAEATPVEDGSKKVYDSMREMMKGVRGFTLAEVNNDPALYQGFYTALGERLGRDPYELSQEYPLTLERGDAPKMPSEWTMRKAGEAQAAAAFGEQGGLTPTRDAILKQGGIDPQSLSEAMGKNLSAQDIIELGVGRKLGMSFEKMAESLRQENGGHLVEGSSAELLQHLTDELTAAREFKNKYGDSMYRRMRGEMNQGERPDYGGDHRPPGPDGGAPLNDLTGGGQVYPADVYSSDAARLYGHGEPSLDNGTMSIVRSFKDRPNALVTIYRAIPKKITNADLLQKVTDQMARYMARGKVPDGESKAGWYDRAHAERERLRSLPPEEPGAKDTINPGDWVTVNRQYAKEHGESALNGEYKIISKKVKAKEVFTNGDSIHEYGYFPEGSVKTDSPEFKSWFGESKVVDEAGNPLIVYHGTDKKFSTFKKNKSTMGIFWFTSDKDAVNAGEVGAQGRGNVMDLFAQIKNPAGWTEYDKYGLGELKNLGYDGAILPDGNGKITGFVFEPGQFKSAIKNTGKFDPKNPNIYFQSGGNAPAMYSALQRTITEKMPESAPVSQVQGLIKDMKAEERKWSGIDEFLAGREKVGKGELLEFLRANQLQVKDVTLVDNKGVERAFVEQDENGKWVVYGEMASKKDVYKEEGAALARADQYNKKLASGATKFESYTLPGGKNYREVLFTLPEPAQKPVFKVTIKDQIIGTYDTRAEAEADAKGRKGAKIFEKEADSKPAFRSGHFNEPNVLAHVRLDDRTDAEGKKVLFVEEVQSDWHQKGRKQGYQGDAGTQVDETAYNNSKSEFDKIRAEAIKAIETVPEEKWLSKTSSGTVYELSNYSDYFIETEAKKLGLSQEQTKIFLDLSKAERALKLEEEKLNEASGEKNLVPDAPFRKTWHEFALKRVLRMAAEGGYDSVAWTTGEQQAERYDLSKQVDEISLTKLSDGKLELVASKNDESLITKYVNSQSEVADLVGKEQAEKLFGQLKETDFAKTSGADLKVGGEGMKGFYDKILPDFANKFGKKYGAKVEDSTVKGGGKGYVVHFVGMDGDSHDQSEVFKTKAEASDWADRKFIPESEREIKPSDSSPTVHSIPITQTLKDAALNEGFPMFQGGEKPRGSYNPETRTIKMFKSADESTFLHESGHYFLDVFTAEAEKSDAPEELKSDFKTLLTWLGADSSASMNETHHEKFARGFEAYLREGKAPSSGLRRAFSAFKNWLMDLYKNVSSLKVDLTPEVRGVMDRMFASTEAIKKAQDEAGYRDFIGEEVDPVLPPALAGKLKDLRDKARSVAEATITREQVDQMKAANKSTRESERQGITQQATLDTEFMPLFQAIDILGPKAKKMAERILAGKEKEGERQSFDTQARVWGFKDANDLASQVATADKEKAIKAQVDARMTPVLKDSPDLQARAREAVHSNRSDEVLALEREVLFHLAEREKGKLAESTAKAQTAEVSAAGLNTAESGAKARQNIATKALRAAFEGWNAEATKAATIRAKQAVEANRAYATTTLADKPYQQAGLFKKYLAAERQAAKRAGEATGNQDFLGADKAKREQGAAHAMAAQAMKNEKVVKRAVGGLREWVNRGRDLRGLPFGYVTKIDSLLSDFGLAEARAQDPAMDRLAEKMQTDGATPTDIANATGLVAADGNWRHETIQELASRLSTDEYKILIPDAIAGKVAGTPTTMRELLSVSGIVKQIAGLGEMEGKLLNEYKRGEAIDMVGAKIRQSTAEKFPIRFNAETGVVRGSVKLLMKGARDLVGVQRIVEALDRGKDGFFHEYFYRPAEIADNAEKKMVRQVKMAHAEIVDRHYKPEEYQAHHKEVLDLPSFPQGFEMTREQAITWAGYQGISGKAEGRVRSAEKSRYMENPRDTKRGTFYLSDAMVNELKGALTKNDWDFVHARWRLMDTFNDAIKANELATRGVEAAFQKHAQVETPYGVYEGGYQHLTYDYSKTLSSYKGEPARNELYKQYSSAAAHTEEGYQKMVTDFQGRPLRFDTGVFTGHIEDLAHDLNFRAPVIDLNRMLRDHNIQESIGHALGTEGGSFFKDWVKSLGTEYHEPLVGYVQKPIRFLRQSFTFSILGIRASVFFRALATNVENAYQENGLKGFSAGLADYAMNPGEITAFNKSKSEFMRDQQVYSNRELADLMSKGQTWAGEATLGGKAKNLMQNLAFLPHKLANQKVSQKMFYDIYQSKVGEVGEQKATLLAEEAVKSVFGSGLQIDQAKILRGGDESKRMVTAGYSFFSAMFGRYWEKGFAGSMAYREENTPKAMAILASSLSWMTLFAAGEVAVQHFARNKTGQQDETLGDYALEAAEIPFTMVPFLGSVARYGFQRAIKGHAEFELTGLEGVLTRMIDPEIDLLFRHKFDPEKVADAASMMARVPLYFKDEAFNFLDWMNGDIEPEWRDLMARRRK